MSQSSATSAPANAAAPLPLIRCPVCNDGMILWFVSNTSANPGRHFFKCENHGKGGCSFWKWENQYRDFLRSRWGQAIGIPSPEETSNPQTAILMQNEISLQNQEILRNILMVCVANLGALLLIISHQ